ncbi:MAG: hypothetical protein M1840_004640 [Geoglossum simile]|nr:MAG: hypothetical protein M1840_004640 [Geoglossum simile]
MTNVSLTTQTRRVHRNQAIDAPQYSVQQVLAFDKPALVQFLVANRDARGIFDISDITDWNHVSDALRVEVQKRILDDIAAARREASVAVPGTRDRQGVPDTVLSRAHPRRWQAGGSLETLDEIYQNPAAYAEIWRPWQGDVAVSSPDDLELFSRPLERWKEFRRWLRHNRGLRTAAEESFTVFLEENRSYFESAGLSQITARPDFEKTVRGMWQQEKGDLQRERVYRREVRDGTLAEYEAAAQRRLASHGFSQPFRLLEDPDRQDERVTWIEYLEFECWWLDQTAKSVQRREQNQPGNDDTGERLQDDRVKSRHSGQQLRVQWVLGKMPPAEEALTSTAPQPATESGATRKRRRRDGAQTADVTTGQVAKRQKQGKRGGTRQVAERKVLVPRLLLGLETPVAQTRIKKKDGTRRSARIKAMETQTKRARNKTAQYP